MANPTVTNTTPPPMPTQGGNPAALTPVLVFTGLNSLGTGAVQTGIFFLLRSAFGFGTKENFVFGLFLYAAYVLGALTIGPMLKRRTRPGGSPRRGPFARWTTRRVLIFTVVCQAGLSMLPAAAALATDQNTPPLWTMWVVGIGFGVLSGMMWPILESYLAGGRSGTALRAATGRFNIVWSAAVVAAFWLMAPLLRDNPMSIITALGFVQAGSVGCLLWLSKEPARHVETRPEPHPESWGTLLIWFRVLLPLGYVLSGVLSPLLPTVIARLGVEAGWMTPVASAWVTSRVLIFVIFERWHGWHGRAWMPVLAGVCLIAGFAGTVLVPGSAGVWALILMLGLFGVGHAVAYIGSLYYAMEIGNAEVDAGGTHEALIGIGYGVGPLLGIAAAGVAGASDGALFEGTLVGLVGFVCLLGFGIAAWLTRTKNNR